MKYLKDIKTKDLKNKISLVRVDLNILKPTKNSLRIRAIIPTINYLLKNKAKIIILSHRGRPDGESVELSLKPFAKLLSFHLNKKVNFIPFKDIFDFDYRNSANNIFLLENLRFFKEETENNSAFAKKLASLGDIYINDAFALCHRKNASIVAITKYIPSYAGFLLEKEIKEFDEAMTKFRKPLVILLGGAKPTTKIRIIKHFEETADYFLLGKYMAFLFLEAKETPLRKFKLDKQAVLLAKKILKKIEQKIIVPVDSIKKDQEIFSIGPETVNLYKKYISLAKTIIWNGPFGMIEKKEYRKPTLDIAKAILNNKKAKIYIGGGETTNLISNFRPKNKNLFLSTGGGAMLEYISGKKLPGIEALNKSKK